MKPTSVIFFANGNTAVCDSLGRQIPRLQKSWMMLFLSTVMDKSDLTKLDITLPNGIKARILPVGLTGDYTWSVEPQK